MGFYFFLLMMSGVTASSTFTVVLTPYTTVEAAASATERTVHACKDAQVKTINKLFITGFTLWLEGFDKNDYLKTFRLHSNNAKFPHPNHLSSRVLIEYGALP